MGKIIGIDLGTSNSAAAVMIGGKPTIIQAAEGTSVGGKAFPSVVAFTKDGQLLVGEPARRQMISNPEGTVAAAKRKMGTDFKFHVLGKEYTPQQISSFILQKIKKDSEAFLGDTVDKAVITVPAYFNDNQRQATKDAGEIAGLQVVRIINEPTAASLAYGLDKAQKDLKIMVFDLGGGTLDVTIMEMGGGVFQVKSTSGDTQLGGTDMDNTLVSYVVDEFKKQSGIDVNNDKAAMMRVIEAAEKAKIELSNVVTTEINLPFLAYDAASGPKNLVLSLSRAKLEELVRPIIERCKTSIMQALQDGKLSPADIDKIILIGGPTRMPMVRQFVGTVMGKEAERGIDPMEAVAMGAAIQGAIIAGDVSTDILLVDVTPLTLGVEVLGGLKEAKITITANAKLSKDEIEKLKKESEQFAEADKKKKEEAEIKNEADNLVYSAEKLVKEDLKDKIKPEQAERINKAAQELKDAISSNNSDTMKSKTQELKNILGEVSTEVYKAAGAAPSAAAAGATGPTAEAGTTEGAGSFAGSSSPSGTTSPPP